MKDPTPAMSVQWRVRLCADDEIVSPRARYDFDNLKRQPPRATVAQLTLEGRLIYTDFDGVEHDVLPMQLMLFNHGEPTRYHLPPRRDYVYRCAWVQMQGIGLAEHLNDIRRRIGSILSLETTGLSRPFRSLQQVAARRDRLSSVETVEAVHRFMLELLRCSEDTRTRALTPVQHAVERLRAEPTRPWSLKRLASEHGCSREHLIRVFRQVTGHAPGAFLAEARLHRAVELLENTRLSLDVVAQQSGYATTRTMARCVRVATGQSPTRLRAGAHHGTR